MVVHLKRSEYIMQRCYDMYYFWTSKVEGSGCGFELGPSSRNKMAILAHISITHPIHTVNECCVGLNLIIEHSDAFVAIYP